MGNAVQAVPGSSYGDADENQHIVMDDVACTGRESFLADCSHISWDSHDCRHHEDAGVKCQGRDSVAKTFEFQGVANTG